MYTHTEESQRSLSPTDALEILVDGNVRFCANLKSNRNLLQQVNDTQDGQWPFAAILSCIDSRTSAELIFDQGLGDVFSIRIAGNILNDDILGSLEFACAAAGAKLVVVLGHSKCGAIRGACDGVEMGHLTGLLKKVQPSIETVSGRGDAELQDERDDDFVQAVARDNVKCVVDGIPERSGVLQDMKSSGRIEVVGAMYDVASGAVDFLPFA